MTIKKNFAAFYSEDGNYKTELVNYDIIVCAIPIKHYQNSRNKNSYVGAYKHKMS